MVLFGGDAGLRCGEMIALEWSDVDLASGNCASVSRTGTGKSERRRVDGYDMCR